MKKIKVLLVDDHTLFRARLRSLIELEADMEVVGEADNGRLAMELTSLLRPLK
jgi:YesN/AraC family two-component response regulator